MINYVYCKHIFAFIILCMLTCLCVHLYSMLNAKTSTGAHAWSKITALPGSPTSGDVPIQSRSHGPRVWAAVKEFNLDYPNMEIYIHWAMVNECKFLSNNAGAQGPGFRDLLRAPLI